MSAFFQRIRTLSCIEDSSQSSVSRSTSSATLVRSSHYQPSEKPVSILQRSNQSSPRTLTTPEFPWSFTRISCKAFEPLNPQPNVRITLSPPPFPRYGHTLTAIPTSTGDLILFGGLVDNEPRNDVFAFSVADNYSVRMIETFGDIPSPRFGHACVVVGNAVIVWGGDTRVDQKAKAVGDLDSGLYVLNVETRKWTRINVEGPSPEGRYGHTMTVVGTKLYIFGGQNDARFSNDVIVFDIPSIRSGAKWEMVRLGDDCLRPAERTNHVCVPYKDRLIIFGGTDGQYHYNDVWSFNVKSLVWTELVCNGFPLPTREGHAATIIDDTIYIFGGRGVDGRDLGDLGALRISNRKWYMFQKMGPKPTPRSGHTMANVGSEVILLGGLPGIPAHGVDPKDTTLLHVLKTGLIKYPKDNDA